jgi:DNA replication protein DnaC
VFARKATGGLFLSGKTGRGKTHLAAAIVREVLLSGGRVRWETCSELISSLRDVYHPDSEESERKILGRLGTGLLILDDLGAARITPMVQEMLTTIIDRSERYARPVVVTTNLSLQEIAETIDERVASRIAGLCGSHDRILAIDGPDHRVEFWKK